MTQKQNDFQIIILRIQIQIWNMDFPLSFNLVLNLSTFSGCPAEGVRVLVLMCCRSPASSSSFSSASSDLWLIWSDRMSCVPALLPQTTNRYARRRDRTEGPAAQSLFSLRVLRNKIPRMQQNRNSKHFPTRVRRKQTALQGGGCMCWSAPACYTGTAAPSECSRCRCSSAWRGLALRPLPSLDSRFGWLPCGASLE